jgi:hypothetical protein
MGVNESFTNTKIAKDHVQNILDIDPAGEPPQSGGCRTQFFGDQFLMLPEPDGLGQCPIEGAHRLFKQMTMPRARYDSGFDRRKILFGKTSQAIDELIYPSAV